MNEFESEVDRLLNFPSLLASAARLRGNAGPRPTPADEVAGQFEAALDACDVVSFDVFDTLLIRRVHHPIEVFLHLPGAESFRRLAPWKRHVAELRINAEQDARRTVFEAEGSGEATLDEIYQAFCRLNGLPVAEASALVAAEEAAELALCIPNPPIRELYQAALRRGKRIIVVSDTYHRQSFIAKLIAAKGFPLAADSVHASSFRRANKRSGQLFRQILPALGVPPARVLHVGDDPVSDYQVPRQLGAVAILHPFRACGERPCANPASPAAHVHSYIRSACAIESRCGDRRGDFWWLLGHNVFGPLLTGFCVWLDGVFRGNGVSRAYFLLRDGEIFHRVYATLFEGRMATPVATLASSRRAFLLPVLEAAPKMVLGPILAGVGKRPAGEYLSRMEIPAGEFEREFRDSGFRDSGEMIEGLAEAVRLERLFSQPRIRDAMQTRSRMEKQNLLGYLRQQGVLDGGRVALVDLGWGGTIHKATHALIQDAGIKPDLIGLYLATLPQITTNAPDGLRFGSYLLQAGKPVSIAITFTAFPQLLEIVCSSSSGSLLYFRDAAEGHAPVFQINTASAEQLSHLAEIHDGIVAFARSFREDSFRFGFRDIPPEIAAENLLRLQGKPTKEEASLIGGLTHGDDAGSTTFRFAARFREESRDPVMLMEDYQSALWKAGLINQPNAQAAVLRTLLWLMQD